MVKTGRQGFRWARLGCIAGVSLFLVSGAVFAAQTTDAQTPPPSVMPWVSDVVKMNDAGIAPDVIANYVRNTDARSTLGADDIIYLRDHGISTGLITTMIQHGAVTQSAPTAQTVPMPATPAPVPIYAQYPPSAAPDYSAYQQQPDVNYNYYSYPNYGYSTPYWVLELFLSLLPGLVLSVWVRLPQPRLQAWIRLRPRPWTRLWQVRIPGELRRRFSRRVPRRNGPWLQFSSFQWRNGRSRRTAVSRRFFSGPMK